MSGSVKERFMRFVKPSEDGCWLWSGTVHKTGYAYFWCEGRNRRAHRVSFSLFVGDVPADRELDHICRVKTCVNPNHLRPVTRLENMQNTAWGDQTHCKRGHPLSGSNIYANHPTRACVQCARERAAAFKLSRREEKLCRQ